MFDGENFYYVSDCVKVWASGDDDDAFIINPFSEEDISDAMSPRL